jgi:uncharacterized protein
MMRITDHAEGCMLSVRGAPGARRTGVQGELAGALKVAVTTPAQDGRANQAILETLRKSLGIKRSQLELVAGETSRNKTVLVRGLSRTELEKRIALLL